MFNQGLGIPQSVGALKKSVEYVSVCDPNNVFPAREGYFSDPVIFLLKSLGIIPANLALGKKVRRTGDSMELIMASLSIGEWALESYLSTSAFSMEPFPEVQMHVVGDG